MAKYSNPRAHMGLNEDFPEDTGFFTYHPRHQKIKFYNQEMGNREKSVESRLVSPSLSSPPLTPAPTKQASWLLA